MRSWILVLTIFVIGCVNFSSSAFGQSGTRSGGISRGSSGSSSAGSSRGGASRSGGAGGFSNRGLGGFGDRRLSPAEQLLLRQQQLVQQQNVQKELRRIQTEASIALRKQELIQLGLNLNSAVNRRQNRLALSEAKNDFQALRLRQLSPNQLGLLQQSFRLREDLIDRERRTAMWPMALLRMEFEVSVQNIDSKIMNRRITDAESAQAFLDDLNKLNRELNFAAANGKIGSTEYARSRRFVSGLANEVHASNLLME